MLYGFISSKHNQKEPVLYLHLYLKQKENNDMSIYHVKKLIFKENLYPMHIFLFY